MKGAKKAMRELKRNKKALQFKQVRDSGGGAREQQRRVQGGFFVTRSKGSSNDG